MKDKLSELLEIAMRFAHENYPSGRMVDGTYTSLMAEYLIDNGVIVPFAECGTDIYGAFEWYIESVFEGTLISYSIQSDGLWFYCHYSNGLNMWHKYEEFGKTVFLTKEEAEKALAERSKT